MDETERIQGKFGWNLTHRVRLGPGARLRVGTARGEQRPPAATRATGAVVDAAPDSDATAAARPQYVEWIHLQRSTPFLREVHRDRVPPPPTTSGNANRRRRVRTPGLRDEHPLGESAFSRGSKLARIRIQTRFGSNWIPFCARANGTHATHTGLVLNGCKKWRLMCSIGAAWAHMKVKQPHRVLP
jgi:hypothetical protein